jgi:hypothetical protein
MIYGLVFESSGKNINSLSSDFGQIVGEVLR